MSDTPAIAGFRVVSQDAWEAGLAACEEYRSKLDKLERENAALREQAMIRDAEIDMWASRCAAAIYMLPEAVTGGQLKEAQNSFYLMLEKARKEAQP